VAVLHLTLLSYVYTYVLMMYRVGQKCKPTYFCNNFVYWEPIFIIFGIYIHHRKFATGGCTVSLPNTVCVLQYLVKSWSRLYQYVCTCWLPLMITKYKKICTLYFRYDITQITALYWNVVHGHKDLLLYAHRCHELLETKVCVSYVVCAIPFLQ